MYARTLATRIGLPVCFVICVLPSAAAQEPGEVTAICLVPPRAQVAAIDNAQAVQAVAETFTSFLSGPSLSVTPLSARLEGQAREEARATRCFYLLFTAVTHVRKEGRGLLGRVAGSVMEAGGYPLVAATGSPAVWAAAGAAGSALREMASSVRARDELTLEVRLEAPDGSILIDEQEKRRAEADGEDLLTPLVEEAAEAIAAAVTGGA